MAIRTGLAGHYPSGRTAKHASAGSPGDTIFSSIREGHLIYSSTT